VKTDVRGFTSLTAAGGCSGSLAGAQPLRATSDRREVAARTVVGGRNGLVTSAINADAHEGTCLRLQRHRRALET
jgi:hypothetical protein